MTTSYCSRTHASRLVIFPSCENDRPNHTRSFVSRCCIPSLLPDLDHRIVQLIQRSYRDFLQSPRTLRVPKRTSPIDLTRAELPRGFPEKRPPAPHTQIDSPQDIPGNWRSDRVQSVLSTEYC